MLETLQHFAFEAILSAIGLALIGAGLALLIAQDGVIEGLPLVGRWILSIRHAAAAVLIGAGCAVLGFVGGYAHRGTVEQAAALQDKIATQEAIKAESERRDEAFANARAADAEYADALAVENSILRSKQRQDDEASHANDSRPGLRRDGVRRLNTIGR